MKKRLLSGKRKVFDLKLVYRGFISMIPQNPAPILKYLPHVCSAFIQYIEDGASIELTKMFRAILQGFKLTIVQT